MKKLRHELAVVYSHLDKILLLFFGIFAIMDFFWIPLNSWMAEKILAMTGQAYLSPTNLFEVLSQNPLATILFGLLVFINFLIAYLEIGFIFTGVGQLLGDKNQRLSDYWHHVRANMAQILRQMRPSKVVFVLFYSVLLLPFLRKILNIYYFNKLLIPQFILDYVSANRWIGLFLTLILLFFFWLATRLIYALPKIYFEHLSVRIALVSSWEKTSGRHQWGLMFKILRLMLGTVFLFVGIGVLLYGVQVGADFLPEHFSLGIALLQFIILKLSYYGAIAYFMIQLVSLLTGRALSTERQDILRRRLQLGILALASLIFGVQGVVDLYFPFDTLPVIISHRGVDDGNGVQNTIDSLEKTASLRPDYIEMDVQETKDLQFVVMHDTDLQALTGHVGGTHDYSLSEMTQMMASENGLSMPVPSFDEYLDRADALEQKLLVEIKVTDRDSKDLMQRFLKKYGQRLLDKGHQMQSLDYPTMVQIKRKYPELMSFFILPFNSIYPTTVADGYTMEYSSLDSGFVMKSWLREKSVYAWTPNDIESMSQMMYLQVDGIITDQLSELRGLVDEFKEKRNYADLLLLQTQILLLTF